VLTQLYHEDPPDVAEEVADLLAMPGVVSTDEVAWSQVLERWLRPISTLGDAIVAAVASRGPFDAVATFDRDLAKKLIRQGTASFWPVVRGM